MSLRFNATAVLALLCAVPFAEFQRGSVESISSVTDQSAPSAAGQSASSLVGNWPQFRGPASQGVSSETGLPLTWSPTDHVRWRTDLPGPGHSSPIVWGDRIFLTAFRSNAGALTRLTGAVTGVVALGHRPTGQLFAMCLDRANGRVLWQREVAAPQIEEIHSTNSPASPTPATDGTLVYVYLGSRGLIAYDFGGTIVWEKPIGPYPNEWGSASSPIVHGDLVLLNVDTDADDFLLAVEKRTGKTVWQTPRPGAERAWPTPIVWRSSPTSPLTTSPISQPSSPPSDEIVVSGSQRVIGYDAASGRERWRVGGLTRWVSPTPVVAHGLLFAASAGPGGNALVAIRPGGRGDVTSTHVAWRSNRGAPYTSSPVVWEDYLFTVRDGGVLACFEARTGKLMWQQRLAAGGAYYSSPLAADGRIYVTSEDGLVTVVAAKPVFQVLATNDLGERTLASPAVSGGTIFIRTDERLWAIR